jgi:hypothetical protein
MYAYENDVRKAGGKRVFGRPSHRPKDNIKKCMLKKQVMIVVQTLFIWHTIGISGGFL